MDAAEQDIANNEYNLVSKILYGGIFSGAIVIPTNFLKIILSLIFPPLGTIYNIIGDKLLDDFPYINWETLMTLFDIKNLNKIIYTFILTSLFYIPGLVYTLSHITNRGGTLKCDQTSGQCKIVTCDPSSAQCTS